MDIKDLAIKLALEQLDKPYKMGGQGPDEWDCSGLVIVIMQHLRVFPLGVDKTAQGIYEYYREKDCVVMKPERGNIIFWGKSGHVSHCALLASPEVIVGANGRSERAVTIESIDYRVKKYNLDEYVTYCNPYKGAL